MKFQIRRPRLEPLVQKSLTELAGKQARALAWGQDTNGRWCVIARAGLFVGEPGEWKHWRWPQIQSGSWMADNGQLRWEYEGGVGTFRPVEPGFIPQMFREMVDSSILVMQTIDIVGTPSGGQVAARRDPADPTADIEWVTARGKGTPDTEEIQQILDEELGRLRAQFE